MYNNVPKEARREIFDEVRMAHIPWHGNLNEADFLGRLYDLDDLWLDGNPSAASDPDYWIFADPVADLLNCSDESFFRFLSLMLYPPARSSRAERNTLLGIFNDHLKPYGYVMGEVGSLSEKPVYNVVNLEDDITSADQSGTSKLEDQNEGGSLEVTAAEVPKPGDEKLSTSPAPKAFVSYSGDSKERKAWVRDLAEKLVSDGVDVELDHWGLQPGDDIALFIETSIRENNHILAICTPSYKYKSELRKGGAGYEGTIITAEILKSSGEDIAEDMKKQIVPIWREGSWDEAAPPWLVGRDRIDLREEDDDEYNRLLKAIHGESPKRPPLGPKPIFE